MTDEDESNGGTDTAIMVVLVIIGILGAIIIGLIAYCLCFNKGQTVHKGGSLDLAEVRPPPPTVEKKIPASNRFHTNASHLFRKLLKNSFKTS